MPCGKQTLYHPVCQEVWRWLRGHRLQWPEYRPILSARRQTKQTISVVKLCNMQQAEHNLSLIHSAVDCLLTPLIIAAPQPVQAGRSRGGGVGACSPGFTCQACQSPKEGPSHPQPSRRCISATAAATAQEGEVQPQAAGCSIYSTVTSRSRWRVACATPHSGWCCG